MEVFGLPVRGEVTPGTDLARLLVAAAVDRGCGIAQGDVLVVASKIVSKAEGRMVRLADVQPSRQALRLARAFHRDPRATELIMRNSGGIEFVLPTQELSAKYHLFEAHAPDPAVARRLVREQDPYLFVARVNGLWLTDGGLDLSNVPEGYCTLPPRDPDASARALRISVGGLTGQEVAVVLTDTEWKLDKFGTVDIAIGASGIRPVSRRFGAPDIYGRPKFGGLDDITDLVAATGALVFGQTSEGTPAAVLRGVGYEMSEEGIGRAAAAFPRRGGARGVAWATLRLRLLQALRR